MAEPMPIDADVLADYRRACNDAAAFDRSSRTKLELRGRDRATFLHGFCTNDINGLSVGQGCEAFVTNLQARVLARVFVFALPDALWIDADPGLGDKLLGHLRKYAITEDVDFFDRSGATAQFHLVGPNAERRMPEFAGTGMTATTAVINGVDCQVRRTDALGLAGVDLLGPAVGASGMIDGFPIALSAAYEILRVEAGQPVYGKEIDETNLPQEINRTAQAISWTKGCYLGQEPICRIRDLGHVNRLLLGLKLSGTAPVPAGAKVFRDGKEVGQVTSPVYSPRLDRAIALAYLRRGHQQPGTQVMVGEGERDAEVTAPPFVAENPAR